MARLQPAIHSPAHFKSTKEEPRVTTNHLPHGLNSSQLRQKTVHKRDEWLGRPRRNICVSVEWTHRPWYVLGSLLEDLSLCFNIL